MKKQYGKSMSHNNIALISLAVVTAIGLILGYTITLFFDNVKPLILDAMKFIVVILVITTFYAPLKMYLLKKFKIDKD